LVGAESTPNGPRLSSSKWTKVRRKQSVWPSCALWLSPQSDDISAAFIGHRPPRTPGADSWSAAEAFPAIGSKPLPYFQCYHRQPKLRTPAPRDLFIRALETVRQQYELFVYGFVVMPEHVHLLVGEPEKGELAQALQSLKQSVARRLALRATEPFWQARYYDFNVWSERKFTEKVRYIHRNPVTRGLVDRPEKWAWSSFRHYLTGEACGVEIESRWTAQQRERLGVSPTVQTVKRILTQAKLGRGTLESRGDR
jgi:putative transposase